MNGGFLLLIFLFGCLAQNEPSLRYNFLKSSSTPIDNSQSFAPMKQVNFPTEGTLLVSTMDGHLHALDVETGRYLWSFGEDSPLLHSSKPRDATAPLIIPGVDGSLFLSTSEGLQKLSVGVSDILSAAPFATGDGTYFIGQKRTRLFLLQKSSGEVHRIVTNDHNTGNSCPPVDEDDDDLVWIGKTDITIKALNGKSGNEQWNISFGHFDTLFEEVPFQQGDESSQAFSIQPSLAATVNGLFFFFPDQNTQFAWTYRLKSAVSSAQIVWGKRQQTAVFAGMEEEDSEDDRDDVIDLDSQLEAVRVTQQSRAKDEWNGRVQRIPVVYVQKDFNFAKSSKNILSDESKQVVFVGETMGNYFAVCNVAARSMERFVWNQVSSIAALPSPSDILSQMDIPLLPKPEDSTSDSDTDSDIIFIDRDVCDQESPFFPQCLLGFRSIEQEQSTTPVEVIPPIANRSKSAAFFSFLNGPFLSIFNGVALLGSISVAVFFYRKWNAVGSKEDAKKKKRKKKSKKSPIDDNGVFSIGKLEVHINDTIGTGSRGTIVFRGKFEGRAVAVKRLVKHFWGDDENMEQEVDLLIDSDHHPNLLRYFAKEEDNDFVYIALELCHVTLFDVFEEKLLDDNDHLVSLLSEETAVLNLIRAVVDGVAHLHSANIVHRDLKPQNILLTADGRIKIGDMGLGKKLDIHRSSFDSRNAGSVGWQAPEVISDNEDKRLTKAVDVFSLGCLIFYIFTNGQHPFGSTVSREHNIQNGEFSFAALRESLKNWKTIHFTLVEHLISHLIAFDPNKRLAATDILQHPLFWPADSQLSLLTDISDRIESEPVWGQLRLLIESQSLHLLPTGWGQLLSAALLTNLGKYRRYDFSSLVDLLRVIRNKKHHYRELPVEVQQSIGALPHGFLMYFLGLFPSLFVDCFRVMCFVYLADHNSHIDSQMVFSKYFQSFSLQSLQLLSEGVYPFFRGWFSQFDE